MRGVFMTDSTSVSAAGQPRGRTLRRGDDKRKLGNARLAILPCHPLREQFQLTLVRTPQRTGHNTNFAVEFNADYANVVIC